MSTDKPLSDDEIRYKQLVRKYFGNGGELPYCDQIELESVIRRLDEADELKIYEQGH